MSRDCETEGDAAVGVAMGGQLATQEFNQAPAQDQPQFRGVARLKGGGIGDFEKSEQPLREIHRDAVAGPMDGKPHLPLVRRREGFRWPGLPIARRAAGADHLDGQLSLPARPDGAAAKIQEDLSKPGGVANKNRRDGINDKVSQLDVFFSRLPGERIEDVFDASMEFEWVGFEGEMAGLDAREIHHVVDERQQSFRAIPGRAQRFPLWQRELGSQEICAKPEDFVHRGPDLPAHVRQTLGLRHGGFLEFLVKRDERRVALYELLLAFAKSLGAPIQMPIARGRRRSGSPLARSILSGPGYGASTGDLRFFRFWFRHECCPGFLRWAQVYSRTGSGGKQFRRARRFRSRGGFWKMQSSHHFGGVFGTKTQTIGARASFNHNQASACGA